MIEKIKYILKKMSTKKLFVALFFIILISIVIIFNITNLNKIKGEVLSSNNFKILFNRDTIDDENPIIEKGTYNDSIYFGSDMYTETSEQINIDGIDTYYVSSVDYEVEFEDYISSIDFDAKYVVPKSGSYVKFTPKIDGYLTVYMDFDEDSKVVFSNGILNFNIPNSGNKYTFYIDDNFDNYYIYSTSSIIKYYGMEFEEIDDDYSLAHLEIEGEDFDGEKIIIQSKTSDEKYEVYSNQYYELWLKPNKYDVSITSDEYVLSTYEFEIEESFYRKDIPINVTKKEAFDENIIVTDFKKTDDYIITGSYTNEGILSKIFVNKGNYLKLSKKENGRIEAGVNENNFDDEDELIVYNSDDEEIARYDLIRAYNNKRDYISKGISLNINDDIEDLYLINCSYELTYQRDQIRVYDINYKNKLDEVSKITAIIDHYFVNESLNDEVVIVVNDEPLVSCEYGMTMEIMEDGKMQILYEEEVVDEIDVVDVKVDNDYTIKDNNIYIYDDKKLDEKKVIVENGTITTTNNSLVIWYDDKPVKTYTIVKNGDKTSTTTTTTNKKETTNTNSTTNTNKTNSTKSSQTNNTTTNSVSTITTEKEKTNNTSNDISNSLKTTTGIIKNNSKNKTLYIIVLVSILVIFTAIFSIMIINYNKKH